MKNKSKKMKKSKKDGGSSSPSAFNQFRQKSSSEKLKILSTIASDSHSEPIPLLEKIILMEKEKTEIKIRAAELLDELGKPVEEEFVSSLRKSEDLKKEITSLLKNLPAENDKQEDFSPIVEKFVSLKTSLQTDLLKQIVEEFPEASLKFLVSITEKEEKLDCIIAETLGNLSTQEAADLLGKMLGTDNKIIRKEVKRSLYRLERVGVFPAIRLESAASVLRRPVISGAKGHLGPIDWMGNRLIWLVLPHPPQGQYLFFITLNDVTGITNFTGGETTRKKVKQFFAEIDGQRNFVEVEADPFYCRFLIEEGYRNAARLGKTLPGEYLTWRKVVTSDFSDVPRPLIYNHYDETEIKSNDFFLDNMGKIRGIAELKEWHLEMSEVEEHIDAINEVKDSKIVLNPLQNNLRREEAIKQTVNKVFNRDRCLLYKRRLEEMAYFFMKLEREEDAKLTFAASLKIDENSPAKNPFLFHLMEKTVSLLMVEKEKQKREEPSLIIKP